MNADRTAVQAFDLIDSHAVGQAADVLERALCKYPDHDGLRAAEALVLLHRNQKVSAQMAAETLCNKDLKDPKALNAVVHILQQCCSWEALAALYERLCSPPRERDMMENLVQTYVRMGAYDKAQQVATRLYRQYNETSHQVWVVQAMLAQVPADSTDHLLLKLATNLLSKSVLTDKGIIEPGTVRAYVDVLMQQRLYDTAVSFLCSKTGSKIGLLEYRLERLAQVFLEKGDKAKANAVAKNLWRRFADNWSAFDLYLNSIDEASAAECSEVLELQSDESELHATVLCHTADRSLADALTLARELQETELTQRPKKPQRGPFMAELAVLTRMEQVEALRSAVLQYAKRFYRKPCCFLDLSTFLTREAAKDIYAWSQSSEETDNDEVGAHARRLLCLRCHVAVWDVEATGQPDVEEMRSLMRLCLEQYERARPLSTSLEWSEEGLEDGYLSVALNIALHAYEANGKDLTWVVRGLDLLHHVERRKNNPGLLIFSACFTQLLGGVDVSAIRQLAFKSVQHDTMSHVGYWPLRSGLALRDLQAWERHASRYYDSVERECSLVRYKVFFFGSWSTMKDIQEFERKQSRSLVRWLSVAHNTASALLDCQTQKDTLELFGVHGTQIWQALEVLGTANDGTGLLMDNTDWLVVRALVLGNIHSEKVKRLTDSLVSAPSREERCRKCRRLLHSLLLVHDVAALESHRLAALRAPKSKADKKHAGKSELPLSTPTLYSLSLLQREGGLDCLPSIAAVAPALLPFLESGGQSAVVDGDALARHLTFLTQDVIDPKAVEEFLYPEAYILVALLQVSPVSKVPIQKWANALQVALQKSLDCYMIDVQTSTPTCLESGTYSAVLHSEKVHRVQGYLSDLVKSAGACARRK